LPKLQKKLKAEFLQITLTLVVNLVRTFPSAKFISFDAILGVIITSHTPKYNEPAKIPANLLIVAQQY